MFIRPFTYRKTGAKPIIFGTFDTETIGLGGELVCITSYVEGEEPRLFTGPGMVDEFLNYVQATRVPIWYAHNLSYDLRRLLEPIISRYGSQVELVWRNTSDVCCISIGYELMNTTGDYDWHKVELRDSYALWPHSLRSLCEHFAPEHGKAMIDDVAHFDIRNPEHVAYALQDAVALWHGLHGFFGALAESFDVSPSLTVASTAVRAWERTLDEDDKFYPLSNIEDKWMRKYYYGALTGLTSTRPQFNVETFDINSSYPSVMETTPMPTKWEWIAGVELGDWILDRDGFVDCVVRTSEDLIVPILPTRDSKGHMIWRRGTFATSVSIPELRFALQHGYELLELRRVCVFTESKIVFDRMVEKCKTLRREHRGTNIEQVAKLIQNSLYGKFGAKRERIVSVVVDDLDSLDVDLFPTVIPNLYLDVKEQRVRALPHWAAWITAHARLRLLETIYRIGPERVIYYDTDSITVERGTFPAELIDPQAYGRWKREKVWKTFTAVAPKVYHGVLMSGERIGKVKGVPKHRHDDELWEQLAAGESPSVSYQTLSSLRAMLRNGTREATRVTRSVTDIHKSTNWQVMEDGTVRPRRLNDVI
jgi:hypothetical protein